MPWYTAPPWRMRSAVTLTSRPKVWDPSAELIISDSSSSATGDKQHLPLPQSYIFWLLHGLGYVSLVFKHVQHQVTGGSTNPYLWFKIRNELFRGPGTNQTFNFLSLIFTLCTCSFFCAVHESTIPRLHTDGIRRTPEHLKTPNNKLSKNIPFSSSYNHHSYVSLDLLVSDNKYKPVLLFR